MSPARRKLMRSREDRVVAGVCAGIAHHFGIDVVIVRVIAVLLLLPGGAPGLIPYLIFWIVLPEGDVGVSASSAQAIAEERYARGEITAEELARLREDLRR